MAPAARPSGHLLEPITAIYVSQSVVHPKQIGEELACSGRSGPRLPGEPSMRVTTSWP